MGTRIVNVQTTVLTWFYRVMIWLSEYEQAIAEATSSNFNYCMGCRERVRYWHREQRLFEMRRIG